MLCEHPPLKVPVQFGELIFTLFCHCTSVQYRFVCIYTKVCSNLLLFAHIFQTLYMLRQNFCRVDNNTCMVLLLIFKFHIVVGEPWWSGHTLLISRPKMISISGAWWLSFTFLVSNTVCTGYILWHQKGPWVMVTFLEIIGTDWMITLYYQSTEFFYTIRI